MKVNERIRDLRNAKGLSQTQVAEKMEMAQSNFAVWESGKTDIPIGKLMKLAEILEVSLAYLLGFEGNATPNDDLEVQRLQTEVERMRRIIDDKDDLIRRIRIDEQRLHTLMDKMLIELHNAYQYWYLDLPPKKSTLEKVNLDDEVFWTQFFSIQPVKVIFEMLLVQNTKFKEIFEHYKYDFHTDIQPYFSRKGYANDFWLSAWEFLQKNDFYTANKQFHKLNEKLNKASVIVVEKEAAEIWFEVFEFAEKQYIKQYQSSIEKLQKYFDNLLNNIKE